MSRHDNPWSEENASATLTELRETYPRYTDNELYAIWCRDQGCIPVDEDGKVLLAQWQMHAAEDGEFVQEGGFKVSRPLFGRAKKAQAGVAKPVGKPRGRAAQAAAEAEEIPQDPQPPAGQVLSDRAVELARRYDRAAAAVAALRPLYRELRAQREALVDVSPALLEELAANDAELSIILQDLGMLPRSA